MKSFDFFGFHLDETKRWWKFFAEAQGMNGSGQHAVFEILVFLNKLPRCCIY